MRRQLPTGLVALPEVEIVVTETWPATVRSPDLVVVRRERAVTSPVRYLAGDVFLAVEVVSPASRKTDEFAQSYEYSDVGIPNYWILDLDGRVTLTAYHLVDGEYEIVGRGSGSIPLTEAAPLTVDVGGLLPRRA